jgi:hypothetical protein
MLERFLDWIVELGILARIAFIIAIFAAGFFLADYGRRLGQEKGIENHERACSKVHGTFTKIDGMTVCVVR